MSIIDTILNIGSCFNWVSPTVAFAQDAINGGAHDIGINIRENYCSERDIKRILSTNNIRHWGTMRTVNGKVVMTTVHPRDARRAQQALAANGIKPEYGGG